MEDQIIRKYDVVSFEWDEDPKFSVPEEAHTLIFEYLLGKSGRIYFQNEIGEGVGKCVIKVDSISALEKIEENYKKILSA